MFGCSSVIDELAGGLLRVLARFIGEIIVSIIFEIIIKGPGYIIVKFLSKPKSEPGEGVSTIVGILFWLLIGGISFYVYKYSSQS
jgi:uncharacterized membrane protein